MLDASQKYDLLKALYLENQKELVFWRERSWATLKLVVSADVAIAGLALFKSAPLALSGLVIALAVVSSVYLYKNYQRYQERRTIGSRIERALGLFEKGAFVPDDTVLPTYLAQPRADKRGSFSFIAAVVIVAIATVFAIAYAPNPALQTDAPQAARR